ncbi:hypothetical protein BE15_41430 [Sorangium cellulosum]|uniref:Uncharacterized protein n=1 Tax=Sorangium cellulosum TaxID=56 RepID=A0A150QJH5_SORCE|nr:hypothetical protein BE15_41430 [Sorangium cellulosum]
MLVPPPSAMPSIVALIIARRGPTGPSGIRTWASLENVTSEKSSRASSRSTSARAASRARAIGSPCMDPLTSSTRCTDRCGRAAGACAVERSATRTCTGPPPGATLARSRSVRRASVAPFGTSIAGA